MRKRDVNPGLLVQHDRTGKVLGNVEWMSDAGVIRLTNPQTTRDGLPVTTCMFNEVQPAR